MGEPWQLADSVRGFELSWNLRYSSTHYPFTAVFYRSIAGLERVTRISPTYDTPRFPTFLRRYFSLYALISPRVVRIYNRSLNLDGEIKKKKKERKKGKKRRRIFYNRYLPKWRVTIRDETKKKEMNKKRKEKRKKTLSTCGIVFPELLIYRFRCPVLYLDWYAISVRTLNEWSLRRTRFPVTL